MAGARAAVLRLSSPVLLDRDDELAVAARTLARPPALVLVEGEAGVGKTRLLQELATGVRPLVGHCVPLRVPLVYGPVVEALTSLPPPEGALPPVTGALGVLSTWNTGSTVPATEAYAYFQGTSQAAPHVAGTVALMLSRAALTPDQVTSTLVGTARPLPGSCPGGCGAGLLDAARAVAAVGAPPPAASQDLAVTAVTASEDDGNVPANTRDGRFSTRWSAEAIDRSEWARFDLGAARSVHHLQVAWYRGDERRTDYAIEVSGTGTTWTGLRSGQSSGSTTGFETYDVPDTTGRYVRIVSDGNTDNDWVSITEVKVFGAATAGPTPTPTASPTGPPPPAGTDPNGVRQIYPTRTGRAAAWTLGYGDWQGRFGTDGGQVSGSQKTTVVTNDGQVRMNVRATTSGCDGSTDHGAALSRGYMCSPDDWTNWELTGYVQVVEEAGDDGDQDWTWYGNGGTHTGDGTDEGCKGSAYKGSYHYQDADVRMAKESYHVRYDFKDWSSVSGGVDYTADRSRWLGMKLVRYEFTRAGQRGVRLELWLDLGGVDGAGNPANSWQRVRVEEDHPDAAGWGEDATRCDAPRDDQVMLWGGPFLTFRWDNTESRLRLASAREIVPPVG